MKMPPPPGREGRTERPAVRLDRQTHIGKRVDRDLRIPIDSERDKQLRRRSYALGPGSAIPGRNVGNRIAEQAPAAGGREGSER
jgi:hypothetical protein